MVNKAVCSLSVFVQTSDRKTGSILFRIAAACHNYAGCTAVFPLNVQLIQCTVPDRQHNVYQIGIQQRQNYLCFRIAEPAVILDDLRSLGCQHQSEIQTAGERSALLLHRTNGGKENGIHTLLCNFRCVVRVRGNSAHAAGVQTLIAVQCTLVIHGRNHRLNSFAVCEAKHRNFRTSQEFFDDNLGTAFPEDLVFHDRCDRIKSFLFILGNDNAFSQCKTVCFDNCGIFVLLFQVSFSFLRLVKYTIFRSRNVILLHQFLGEHLAALQNRCVFLRSKGHEALCLHRICHAQYQRIVRCNKHQIHCQFLCQLDHTVNIGCLYRKTLRILGNAAVARCTVKCLDLRALCQFHDDGVFPSAAANH